VAFSSSERSGPTFDFVDFVMHSESQQSGLEIEQVGDVAVVRFTHRSLLGPDLIEAVAAELVRAVEELGYRKLVLNFANVESMTTAMVGKLVSLQQRTEKINGRLVLCGISPFLLEIFKILNLTKNFTIVDDEQTALESHR
jgi:anti-anti-sigma factor